MNKTLLAVAAVGIAFILLIGGLVAAATYGLHQNKFLLIGGLISMAVVMIPLMIHDPGDRPLL